MKTVSVTEAKAKLTILLKELADYEQIYLTRNGQIAGVLVNLDEWESLLETLEILSDPDIMKQITAGKHSKKLYTMKQVFKDIT